MAANASSAGACPGVKLAEASALLVALLLQLVKV